MQIVYKALMLIHILMREGDSIRILDYLANFSTEDWWELPNLSIKTDIGIKYIFHYQFKFCNISNIIFIN